MRGQLQNMVGDSADGQKAVDRAVESVTVRARVKGFLQSMHYEPGEPIDGFPVPKGARQTTKTPQAVVLQTELSAKQVVAFYRYHLRDTFGPVKLVPNGLQVTSADSPFSYISLSKAPNGLMIILA